jgi:hypothetical protein
MVARSVPGVPRAALIARAVRRRYKSTFGLVLTDPERADRIEYSKPL